MSICSRDDVICGAYYQFHYPVVNMMSFFLYLPIVFYDVFSCSSLGRRSNRVSAHSDKIVGHTR